MKILKIYEKKLRFKNYSKRTIEMYSCYLEKFLIDIECVDAYQIRLSQIKNYLESKQYTSISQQNQYIGSLKLFAKYILNKKNVHLNKIERPKKQKSLPKVIDSEYLKETISNIYNLKHRAIISLAYSCALRVSEVINLKIEDIDSKRMIIHIRNAKGGKDRIVKLSDSLLIILRNYFKQYRPLEYLFNGQSKLQYTASSCNKIVKLYLGDKYHFHLLRHSALTDMHENGVDIATISKIAGHQNILTSMIYTHVSNRVIQNTYSPI